VSDSDELANFPSYQLIDGRWQSNLDELEKWYWKGMERFRSEGSARLHVTYSCQSHAAAVDLAQRLKESHAETVDIIHYGDGPPPKAVSEHIRALSIETEARGNTVSILTNLPGWRVRMTSPVIVVRNDLGTWFAVIKAVSSDNRWHMENSGIGP